MKKRILIFASEYDSHATVVSAALSHQGHDVTGFGLDRLPFGDTHSFSVSENEPSFDSTSTRVRGWGQPFDAVWFRRITHPSFDEAGLADDDAEFVGKTYAFYGVNLYACFAKIFPSTRDAFWVNPLSASFEAENKLIQLHYAREAGLGFPPTLITTDPDELRAFQRRIRAPLVCKSLVMADGWRDEHGRNFASFSARVEDVTELPRQSVRLSPAIYQPYVDKQYEVRTFFLGTDHFSVRIDSQSSEESKIDWRVKPGKLSPYRIPDSLAGRCRALMERFGLRSASFDFIRCPDGRYLFLEVNQAGQFIFLESLCPEIPVIDAFCHFIVHGNLENWKPHASGLSLEKIMSWDGVDEHILKGHQLATERALRLGRGVRID